jgi:hypothetical protein
MRFKKESFLSDFIDYWVEANDAGDMPCADDLWEFIVVYLEDDIEDWLGEIEERIRESFKVVEADRAEWEQHIKEHSGPL